jgi:hypothetical protein
LPSAGRTSAIWISSQFKILASSVRISPVGKSGRTLYLHGEPSSAGGQGSALEPFLARSWASEGKGPPPVLGKRQQFEFLGHELAYKKHDLRTTLLDPPVRIVPSDLNATEYERRMVAEALHYTPA